jgi:hypothetical protein
MMSVVVGVRSDTRYELPREGTTLLGYVVRRMHKTVLLMPVGELLDAGRTAEALAQVALYAAGASTSFGRAFYQPEFDQEGAEVGEPDPATGAQVRARLASLRPHGRLVCTVDLIGVGRFSGEEEIRGTALGLTGLDVPAPSRFEFSAPDRHYRAELTGVITSELVPGLWTAARVRGFGDLLLQDSAGDGGVLRLSRNGQARVEILNARGERHTRRFKFSQ